MPTSHRQITGVSWLATSNRHSSNAKPMAQGPSMAPQFPPLGLVRRPPFAGDRGIIGPPARAGILQPLTVAGADERPLCRCGIVPECSLLRAQAPTVRGGHPGGDQAASGTSAPTL